MTREDIINFDKLRKTCLPYDFVREHNGKWNHQNWLDFCSQIYEAGYCPIDLNKVGSLLESLKDEFYLEQNI
jgi:hypothetical protein